MSAGDILRCLDWQWGCRELWLRPAAWVLAGTSAHPWPKVRSPRHGVCIYPGSGQGVNSLCLCFQDMCMGLPRTSQYRVRFVVPASVSQPTETSGGYCAYTTNDRGSNNNNNNRRLVTLAEHTSDHGRQTNSSTEEKGEQV